MQVNLHNSSGNQFSHYDNSSVSINGTSYNKNIIVNNNKITETHLINISELNEENLQSEILSLNPELIIFGTGTKITYPRNEILIKLQKLHIGFEVMPIPALCRTFNYLIGEGRNVVAIILF